MSPSPIWCYLKIFGFVLFETDSHCSSGWSGPPYISLVYPGTGNLPASASQLLGLQCDPTFSTTNTVLQHAVSVGMCRHTLRNP